MSDELGTKVIPDIFRHPFDKSKQYADSECPFCYIEEQHRELKRLREALDKLARLGNGDHYGNSDGNIMAQKALEKNCE